MFAARLLARSCCAGLSVWLSACEFGTVAPDPEPPGSEPSAGPESCEGLRLTDLVVTDIWGRPLDATVTDGDVAGLCAPRATLSCGDVVRGDTRDPQATTDAVAGWPVATGNYGGREAAYRFRARSSSQVRWELVDPRPTVANHDLFVLDAAAGCAGEAATVRGFNSVKFDAIAGQEYLLVLDSFAGDEGEYAVRLVCDGAPDRDVPAPTWDSPGDGPIQRVIEAPDHLPTTLSADIIAGAFERVELTGTARYAISNEIRPVDGRVGACNVQTLYVGLDHAWYAASADRPPRDGNDVVLHRSGETFFADLIDDLQAAESDVHIATWWWMSDMELVRPSGHHHMTEAQRRPYTAIDVLDRLDADKKVLVSRFCDDSCFGLLDSLTMDDTLADRGETPGDGFEIALQGNPTEVPLYGDFDAEPIVWNFTKRAERQPEFAGRTFEPDPVAGGAERFDAPIASFHQKMLAIDGRVAFIGGMNIKSTDWDTAEHRVFDERRMDFDATTEERMAVRLREDEPDLAPRKDYGLRVEGPLAADVDETLRRRWAQAIADGEPYTEDNTTWTAYAPADPLPGGLTAQYQVTMPAPAAERSILESQLKAIRQAERFIYIEDQYWRAPLLTTALLEVLKARPQVKLIVVTGQVLAADPASHWTIRTDTAFRQQVPDQYVLLTTRSFDVAPRRGWLGGEHPEVFPVAHSLHSKLLIVDDEYLSVGSCNKNNRGFLYEGEANVALVDRPWVRTQRRAVWKELVGPRFAGQIGDQDEQNWMTLRAAAAWNEDAVRWWEANADDLTMEQADAARADTWPSGFVYPLDLPDWSVLHPGPDAF